jgi:hypothetical protein
MVAHPLHPEEVAVLLHVSVQFDAHPVPQEEHESSFEEL